MAEFEYKELKTVEYRNKTDDILDTLPKFCRTYVNGYEGTVSAITMYEYIQHINLFFGYLHDNNSYFGSKPITEISLDDIDNLDAEDIEEFMHYIRSGSASDGKRNKENSVNHYLCALNSLWKYLASHKKISQNVIKDIVRGGNKEKRSREVITMNSDEAKGFFQSITQGKNLTKHQEDFRNDVTVARDKAICTILVKTGLRVSELVGLNMDDISTDEFYFHVLRKGNKVDKVYYSDYVLEVLNEYLSLRPLLHPSSKEKAVFLVSIGRYKGQRLSVRSVQNLVKKYAQAGISKGTKITPHKMRSTYASDLLEATNDINLVQNAMNHESPATTSLYLKSREKDLKENRNIL